MVAILCLVILMGLYSIYWYTIAENLKESITLFLIDQIPPDFNVSFKEIEVVGYPSIFRIMINKPSLAANLVSQSNLDFGWQWKGTRIIAEVKPWSFKKLRVNLSGGHQIIIKTSKEQHQYTGKAADLTVDVELNKDGLPASAKLIGTVKISLRYIDTGSLVFSPILKAELGVEGVNIASTFL